MSFIRRILAAVDPAEVSSFAWLQARELARALGASVEAVYLHDARDDEAVRLLRERIGPGIHLHVVRSPGPPGPTLLRLAADIGPDLLVLGRHNRSRLGRLLLGSVAEEVVDLSPVAVWTVHEPPRPIKAILAPFPLSHDGLTACAWALALAKALDASVTILHLASSVDESARTREVLDRLLSRLSASSRRRVRVSVVRGGDGIFQSARLAADHDLTVISAPRRPIRDRLLASPADRLLRLTPSGVVCVPPFSTEDARRYRLLSRAFSAPREAAVHALAP